jgi:hypothetical protein
MKKVLLFLFVSFFGIAGYAQTAREKKAAKTDLDNIKRFYDRLKSSKIDTKTALVWEYTYQDSTEIQLQKLSEAFEKGGMKTEGITLSPKPNNKIKIYELKMSEVKKYSSPEAFNERVNHLNEVAQVYKILNPYATFGAQKPEKTEEIGTYKKVRR